MVLPIEVLGADGTVVSRTVTLPAGQAEPVRSLWLQIHGLRYADQASVQVNTSAWIPLNNNTVTIAEPGRTYGGIGGGFATLVMTLALPDGTVVGGDNTIRFRFNHTDGFVSSYRVLAWNFLNAEGKKILPANDFVEDAPESWTPPLPDAASIQAGKELWHSASLAASSLPNSPTIQAHCADCHAQDGRDLKYFNFSNASIIARARFHGLSELQSEQIASYIRSLPLPNPGRPWNPPYQPGPGLDEQPVSNWAAGAGLAWVLDQDTDALPYLIGQHGEKHVSAVKSGGEGFQPRCPCGADYVRTSFAPTATSMLMKFPSPCNFRTGTNGCLAYIPRTHGGQLSARASSPPCTMERLRRARAREERSRRCARSWPRRKLRITTFARWLPPSRNGLKPGAPSSDGLAKQKQRSPELTNKVYSAQLWQLVKTWEMMQEFGLEARGRDLFGATADSRTWCNTVPGDAAPAAAHIPNGPAGVGGSALTNEYLTSAWYELQIILNSGNHQHREREPVDWVYVIAGFLDLQAQTHQPEPARLLVAVTKALQSSDPRLGPDNIKQGWRPNDNIDPRIMISPVWAPIFKPLPVEVHQALTTSMLAAWMDKNLEYPITKHLPVGVPRRPYTQPGYYGDISGGNVWQSAKQFRDAGVPPALVQTLQQWGAAYADRAARIQY